MDNFILLFILLLGFSAICYVISLLQQANKQLRKINIGNNNISKSEIDELIGMYVRDFLSEIKMINPMDNPEIQSACDDIQDSKHSLQGIESTLDSIATELTILNMKPKTGLTRQE